MTQASTSALDAHAARLKSTSLTALFAADASRVQKLTLKAPYLLADFSKQKIDDGAVAAFADLAKASDFEGWRAKLFGGEIVNPTEGRPAKHWALRGADAPAEVHDTRTRMRAFAQSLIAGDEIDAIIHLGIGGSDLGPRLIMDALKPHHRSNIEVRFAANVDGADVADSIAGLDPNRTLLIVASKTFTTQETLANAKFVREWGPKHLAAVTAAPDKAVQWGAPPSNVFAFWDWVGGRYSLWSSVGLVCDIALKDDAFSKLLDGAAEMDEHFRTAPFAQNLPAFSAAVQHWNREQRGRGSYALIPYSERLRLLPAYLQQLEMESNGKRVDRDGKPIDRAACGVTWGAAGTNAQHSFFQLLHQGVDEIPVEFILNMGPHEGPADHRAKLFANALAQTRALMVGKSEEAVKAEMIAKGVAPEEAARLAPHRTFTGDRASTMIGLDALSPQALGALIAYYEHRTFTQAVFSGVNPFDQWGVELGKEMANQLAPVLEGAPAPAGLDASTSAWIERLK